jgi:hypothetical protein
MGTVNSLTAMGTHERPLFDKLLWSLVRTSQHLMARKIAELFSLNRGIRPFYAAFSFDQLTRGFVLCLLMIALENDFTTPQFDF